MRPPARAPSVRTSRTRYVALGMLAIGPATGYELSRRIEESVGYFWQESFGQLYPAMQALAKEGLVVAADATDGARSRTRYAISSRGLAALGEWLRLPPALPVERNELLLKVFLAGQRGRELSAAHVRQSQAMAREALAMLHEVDARIAETYGHEPDLPMWRLTVRYGVLGLSAHLAWCDEALAVLEAPQGAPSAARVKPAGPRAARPAPGTSRGGHRRK